MSYGEILRNLSIFLCCNSKRSNQKRLEKMRHDHLIPQAACRLYYWGESKHDLTHQHQKDTFQKKIQSRPRSAVHEKDNVQKQGTITVLSSIHSLNPWHMAQYWQAVRGMCKMVVNHQSANDTRWVSKLNPLDSWSKVYWECDHMYNK